MKTAFISYVFGNDHAVVNYGTFKMMASFDLASLNIKILKRKIRVINFNFYLNKIK